MREGGKEGIGFSIFICNDRKSEHRNLSADLYPDFITKDIYLTLRAERRNRFANPLPKGNEHTI